MIRIIQYIILSVLVFRAALGFGQDSRTVALHIQFYDEGVCTPMLISNHYSTSLYQKEKSVLMSGSYFSTIYIGVISSDSADLEPITNHELQSSSLRFNPRLDYEIIVYRYNGFDRSSPDTMLIKFSKLDKDAQLILPFKKGDYVLQKMKYFKELERNATPDFKSVEKKEIKNTLQLDSTAYFPNGKTKANYFVVAANFPLYYVREFDSINPSIYSQGFHLLSNYNGKQVQLNKSVWHNPANTKYGYWEYFENGKRIKHEMWVSVLQQKFEWYSSGQLKSEIYFVQNHANQELKNVHYLENGKVKEEFYKQSQTTRSLIKSYAYSPEGTVILINSYNSSNGLTKQDLYKRELFYPSGILKMEENFGGTYRVKYYNEDGTERIK